MRKALCLALLLALLPTSSALAQAPEPSPSQLTVFGRKLATGGVGVVEPGRVRLILTWFGTDATSRFAADGSLQPGGKSRTDSLRTLLLVGLVDNVDLGIFGGQGLAYRQGDEGLLEGSGPMDFALQVRWRFLADPEDGLWLATDGRLTLDPLRNDRPGSQIRISQDFTSWRQSLRLRKDWDRFTLGAQLFYSFPLDQTPGNRYALGGNLALGYQADDWVQPEVELNYTSSGTGNELRLTAGSIFRLHEQVYLLVGVQRGVAGVNQDQITRLITHLHVDF